jgi:hypothetical protein
MSKLVMNPFVVLLPQLGVVVLFEEWVVLVVEYSPFDLILLVEKSVNLFVMFLQLLILMVLVEKSVERCAFVPPL